MRLLSLAFLSASFVLAACHGHDDESYDTLEACVDDHVEEGLSEPNAITHCLVDFGFGDGLTTEAECVAFVTDNGDYPDSRDEACADFIAETEQ